MDEATLKNKKLTTEEVLCELDKWIAAPDDYFETWHEMFSALCALCVSGGYSLSFDYHSGYFQKAIDKDTWSEPILDETLQGWTIVVGMSYFKGETEDQALYEFPAHAVYDGMRLLKTLLEEELGRKDGVLDKHNNPNGGEGGD